MPGRPPREISMETSSLEKGFHSIFTGFIILLLLSIGVFIGYILGKEFGLNLLWILPVGFISWIVGHYWLRINNVQ